MAVDEINLGSQIFQENGKLYGVEKEIEKLNGTVSRIQAILKDAEEQQSYSHQVKDRLKKLKGAVDEADKLLSKYSKTSQQRAGKKFKKKVLTFFSNANQIAFPFSMNDELKIRKKLDAIVKDSKGFKLKVIPTVAAAVALDKEKID